MSMIIIIITILEKLVSETEPAVTARILIIIQILVTVSSMETMKLIFPINSFVISQWTAY